MYAQSSFSSSNSWNLFLPASMPDLWSSLIISPVLWNKSARSLVKLISLLCIKLFFFGRRFIPSLESQTTVTTAQSKMFKRQSRRPPFRQTNIQGVSNVRSDFKLYFMLLSATVNWFRWEIYLNNRLKQFETKIWRNYKYFFLIYAPTVHVREVFPAHFVGFLFWYFYRFLLFSLLVHENEGLHYLC